MTDDILNTTQNPDELRRLATALLTAQACEYEQRLHNLNTVNTTLEQRLHNLNTVTTTLEQRIHDLNAAMQAEKPHMNSASGSWRRP